MSITLWQYYQNLAGAICKKSFKGIKTLADWKKERSVLYRQFTRSMGLDPMPERCELKTTVHGELSGRGYRAKKISFQILPDCWATAVVFYPRPMPAGKLPAVLYVSGHHEIGVHGYQTHGIMWARRRYVCLVLDTIEQHDNPGDHHGLYYKTRYDWISLGYTGAGGELWNSIRALDLLCGLPEVDPERVGVTGNSGGGALSFYVGIADERVKAVAACCGVAMPKYTIADRLKIGHCDCIYYHNPYQRNTSEFAALTAPRPLMFCFAANDSLFSKGEYTELYEQTGKIYRLYGRADNCRLFTYPGPHGYRPQTVSAVNKWFDKHVAGRPAPDLPLAKYEIDEKNITIFNGVPPRPDRLALLPELISPVGGIPLPLDKKSWPAQRRKIVEQLRREVFHHCQNMGEKLDVQQIGNWLGGTNVRKSYRGNVAGVEVWIETNVPAKSSGKVIVGIANAEETSRDVVFKMAENAPGHTYVTIEPRGTHFTCPHPAHERSYLRAAALTGPTPTALKIHDVQLVLNFLRKLPEMAKKQIFLYGCGEAGVVALYNAVLDEKISGVVTEHIPATHRRGAYILGILRHLDIEQALGLIAPRPLALVNPVLFINWAPVKKMWAGRLYGRLGVPRRLIILSCSLETAFRQVLNEAGK